MSVINLKSFKDKIGLTYPYFILDKDGKKELFSSSFMRTTKETITRLKKLPKMKSIDEDLLAFVLIVWRYGRIGCNEEFAEHTLAKQTKKTYLNLTKSFTDPETVLKTLYPNEYDKLNPVLPNLKKGIKELDLDSFSLKRNKTNNLMVSTFEEFLPTFFPDETYQDKMAIIILIYIRLFTDMSVQDENTFFHKIGLESREFKSVWMLLSRIHSIFGDKDQDSDDDKTQKKNEIIPVVYQVFTLIFFKINDDQSLKKEKLK